MRIYKFSTGLCFITTAALLYVHQQVQLLKISYQIEANEKQMATLLDRNKSLVYNITRLKSPVRLQDKLVASSKEFGIPEQWKVIEVASAAPKKEGEGEERVVIAKAPSFAAQLFKRLGRPREVFANTTK